MMGLEPTTFCMASGSWVKPEGTGIGMAERIRRSSRLDAHDPGLPQFPVAFGEFGHKIVLVPNDSPGSKQPAFRSRARRGLTANGDEHGREAFTRASRRL